MPWRRIPSTKSFSLLLLIAISIPSISAEEREARPKPAPVPVFRPRSQPIAPGEFTVGVITIAFKDTALSGSLASQIETLKTVKGRHDESGSDGKAYESSGDAVTLDEYFKIYSNGISWPKLLAMPDANTHYQDPNFYGYYCEYEYWENPLGWKTQAEGHERVEKMNKAALRFAMKNFRGGEPMFLCYNYITTRVADPDDKLTEELRSHYTNRNQDKRRKRVKKIRKSRKNEDRDPNEFKPWEVYAPECLWGDPMWPNSKVQIMNSSSGVLAHELGHSLGAPDTYRIGRFNDGIGGSSDLLPYGPTANAFSRFYHHGFIKAANHPTLTQSGTYTLHPRHIKPEGTEALGYLVPSNHPHYFYHLEYIHGENSTVGVGPKVEGMLISAVNLGLASYHGSPDYCYTYRPGDPFFRGTGDTAKCLFGTAHGRTEFNMGTEPSSRLPNLLDGGVSLKNIREQQGTLSFDLEIRKRPVNGSDYANSMLPQIRLDAINDVQATSFNMDCTIKFRGEPLKTAYGFCWSKSPKPTVRDATFVLRHREHYRGHAIGLQPESTYFVRAFATNGLGYRYSDEELMIKTPAFKNAPTKIGPLMVDGFSNSEYLYYTYSQEEVSSSTPFANFSPTCVLAKLVAYYRPPDFTAAAMDGKDPAPVDFNRMNWNPSDEDFPMRLDEVDGFFQAVKDRSLELGLREARPGKDFIRNLVKFTKVRSKPVLSTLQTETLGEAAALVKADLVNSRPAIIIFCPEWEGANDMICWGLIDGIDENGRFHLELPMRRQLLRDGEKIDFPSGYRTVEDLILPGYTTHLVTSCHYQK